jgi:hypothetical protein
VFFEIGKRESEQAMPKYCHKFNGQGPMGYWLREINMLVHGLGT